VGDVVDVAMVGVLHVGSLEMQRDLCDSYWDFRICSILGFYFGLFCTCGFWSILGNFMFASLIFFCV